MASAEKSAVIAEMTENFRKSTATVLSTADYPLRN